MRTVCRIMFCFAAVALIAFAPANAQAAQKMDPGTGSVSAVHFPAVQLKHWKNSTTQERRAFLMGFVSMLELERAWQGKSALPVGQSTVSTWVRGLSGVTIPEMDNALSKYIAENPGAGERTVLETLGRIYVRPKMSSEERDSASKRYDLLKTDL